MSYEKARLAWAFMYDDVDEGEWLDDPDAIPTAYARLLDAFDADRPGDICCRVAMRRYSTIQNEGRADSYVAREMVVLWSVKVPMAHFEREIAMHREALSGSLEAIAAEVAHNPPTTRLLKEAEDY